MKEIILIIGLIALLTYIIYLKRQIRSITRQLNYLNKDKTRKKIDIAISDKDIEELAYTINENIKKQEQLAVAMKNQENQLKSSIASISHDLRTPLTSIIGYLQLLEGKELSEDRKREYLETAISRSQILNTLINDFFELSIYDSDDYKIKRDKVNFTALLTNTLIENYKGFKEKQVTLTTKLPEQNLYILGDEVACERILQNLISNALRYGEEQVGIEVELTAKYCLFKISNQTSKVREKDLKYLFDRFYRADQSRTSTGTGLGLYVVKTLVEKMQGEIIEVSYKEQSLQIQIGLPIYR